MQKLILAVLMIVSFIFMGFMMPYQKDDYCISRGEELVNCILEETAIIIKNKYKLSLKGAGSSMPGGPIRQLSLFFEVKGPLTKEKLRELLVNSADEFLQQDTQNVEVQQYLKYRPFTIKHIQIIIYNHDKSGRTLHDPQIANGEISRGILSYQTIDPDDTFKYKNEFKETYEEALDILKNQKTAHLFQQKISGS